MRKKVKPVEDSDADEDEAEPKDGEEEADEAEPEDANADEEEAEPEEDEDDDEEEDSEEPTITVPQAHVAEEMDKWQANQALLERLEEGQRRIERRLTRLTHPAKPKPLPSPTSPAKTVKHQTIKARRMLGRLLKSRPQP